MVGADPKDGHGRGVVTAASYAARRYGIRSAMPISRAWRLAEAARRRGEPETVFVPGDRKLYAEVSERIMAILAPSADAFEEASIDEAYLDLSSLGSFEAAAERARSLKRQIAEREGLTCSVGLGPSKLVAKIASDFKKPDGLTVVGPAEVQEFLDPLPIRVIPGIGPRFCVAEHLAHHDAAPWHPRRCLSRLDEIDGDATSCRPEHPDGDFKNAGEVGRVADRADASWRIAALRPEMLRASERAAQWLPFVASDGHAAVALHVERSITVVARVDVPLRFAGRVHDEDRRLRRAANPQHEPQPVAVRDGDGIARLTRLDERRGADSPRARARLDATLRRARHSAPGLRPAGSRELLRRHLMAWGLIGEPTARVMGSGGATNMNS